MFEIPPEDALPLSDILAKLEGAGYTQIVDAEFEGGVWEVEYVVDGEEHELHVEEVLAYFLRLARAAVREFGHYLARKFTVRVLDIAPSRRR